MIFVIFDQLKGFQTSGGATSLQWPCLQMVAENIEEKLASVNDAGAVAWGSTTGAQAMQQIPSEQENESFLEKKSSIKRGRTASFCYFSVVVLPRPECSL